MTTLQSACLRFHRARWQLDSMQSRKHSGSSRAHCQAVQPQAGVSDCSHGSGQSISMTHVRGRRCSTDPIRAYCANLNIKPSSTLKSTPH